jgi:hypothetical protein
MTVQWLNKLIASFAVPKLGILGSKIRKLDQQKRRAGGVLLGGGKHYKVYEQTLWCTLNKLYTFSWTDF